ncbi:Autoinducer 2 sensor kinase/phosphatase LuxQ [Durusdinium trenchii]|uniref:histidine kinase n=1 Tax=Durusdinium trenchii TaxID=1381693 RepID=A0ABP0LS33_9DINO
MDAILAVGINIMRKKTTRINTGKMSKQQSRLFFDANDGLIKTAEQGLEESNDVETLKALHGIKGSALVLGASALAEAVQAVEDHIEARRRAAAEEGMTNVRKELDILNLAANLVLYIVVTTSVSLLFFRWRDYRSVGLICLSAGAAFAATLVWRPTPLISVPPGYENYARSAIDGFVIGYLFVYALLANDGYNASETLLRKARDQLKNERDRAREASRAREEFLAMISHEFRTPLTTLIATTNVLSKRGKFIPVFDNTDLHALARDVINVLSVDIENKGLIVTTDIASSCPSAVVTDPTLLRQVLLNLVSNAVKYTEQGRIEIRFDVVLLPDASRLRIEVQDTGVGIPANRQDKLFDLFSRNTQENRKVSGIGLGLAVCKRIVETLDGEIGVESTLGAGSLFRIEVPLKTAKETENAATPPKHTSLEGLSLLLIEDHAFNRLMLKEQLEEEGLVAHPALISLRSVAPMMNKRQSSPSAQARMRKTMNAVMQPVLLIALGVPAIIAPAACLLWRQQRKEIMQLAEKAQQAEAAKTEFLARMSHELRTPLNGVIGLTELLIQSSDRLEEKAELLTPLGASARHLLTVVNDVLDYSKLEAGKFTLARETFAPAQLMNETVDALRPSAEAKGIALKAYCDDVVPTWAIGDASRTRQILWNLLSNAVKYTEEGEVSVSLSPTARNARMALQIRVADNGPGVPADQEEAIFEKFHQVDGETYSRPGGTGLGLSICRQIARMMGGDVFLEQSDGPGAVFTAIIGIETIADETALKVKRQTSNACPKSPFRGLDFLVVDDNEVNRLVGSSMVKSLGGEADIAGSGLEALMMVESKPYDVILMDKNMPDGLSGIETLEELRRTQNGADTPVYACTADALEGEREAMIKTGFDGYIAKPITIDRLRHELRALPQIASESLH